MRTHSGEKPFKCGAQFIQCCYLRDHARLHTGEKPFKCDSYGAQFACCSNLNARMRTGKKPFKCDTCSALFGWNNNLKVGMRTHPLSVRHGCTFCLHYLFKGSDAHPQG